MSSSGFGASRLEEFRGKHKLDVVFVYGAEPHALTQAPGGRDNAFMISKTTFELLSLPDTNGNYFLRPDRILGVFLIDPVQQLSGAHEANDELESERAADQATKDSIINVLREMDQSDAAIMKLLSALNPSTSNRGQRTSLADGGSGSETRDTDIVTKDGESQADSKSDYQDRQSLRKQGSFFQWIATVSSFQRNTNINGEEKAADTLSVHEPVPLSRLSLRGASAPALLPSPTYDLSRVKSGNVMLGTSLDGTESMRRTTALTERVKQQQQRAVSSAKDYEGSSHYKEEVRQSSLLL